MSSDSAFARPQAPAKKGHPRGQRKSDIFLLLVLCAIALVFYSLRVAGAIPQVYVLLVYSVVILIGGYLAIRIVSIVLERRIEPKLGVTRTHGLKNFFQVAGGTAILVLVLSTLGVNLTAVLVGAGFLGIVLGLAAQQVLGNIFAGLSLLASRPFEIGDRVTISTSSYGQTGTSYTHENEPSGFTGTIVDIGLFYTHVHFDEGTPAIFPNSVVIGSLVINHSRATLRTIRIRLDLDKNVDYKSFKAKIVDSLSKYGDLIDQKRTNVDIVDIGTSTYQVIIVAWAKTFPVQPTRTLIFEEALKVQSELRPKSSIADETEERYTPDHSLEK